jgi:hypothetical protein
VDQARAGSVVNCGGPELPVGFGTSYDDAAAAAVPGGPLLLVAGTAPGGQGCIAGGSVAITNVFSSGRLGAVRLISDQRGTGQFDDRLAAGTPGGRWRASVISPPGGADLLLPALGPLSPTAVRLVCAVHAREGDRLGYDWADLSLDQAGHATAKDTLALLTPAPRRPGILRLGEELSITRTPGGLLSSVVVAGRGGASL